MEHTVSAKIAKIEEVMNLNLAIPNYQRPYRWEIENVRQMLEDIKSSMESGKQTYRIGTVILHDNNDVYDIVDGQQRLTTLSLITKILGISKFPCLFYDSLPEVEEFFKEFYKTDYSQVLNIKNKEISVLVLPVEFI